MEDTFLNVLFVVISLLLSKEHDVFQNQDDGVTEGMRDHEHVLLQERAEEPSIATDLPHSNQQASQSQGGVWDVSDVKRMMPNVRTAVPHEEQTSSAGDQNDFRQPSFAPDDQEKSDVPGDKWTSHMSNTGQIDIDRTGSNVDQNFSQGDEELPKKGQIDTHHDNQASMMGQDNANGWYLWKTLSLISMIRFVKWIVKLAFKPQAKALSSRKGKNAATFLNSEISEMDYKTLNSFYNQWVQIPPNESWQICEFVEGFANDLLETVNGKNPDMKIENFVGVGSLYEQWASRKGLVCDIHVPIIPPKPYSFEFELLRDKNDSSALYGRVKIVKETNSSICVCNDSNLDDDTLCLLHPENKNNNAEDYIIEHLCQEDSPNLSKTHVVKWFRNAIKQAWEEISHKYDFELTFRNRVSPGSFKVRFRSGKVILFNITPVIRFRDSEAHLISHLPSIGHVSDTQWPVCVARYENSLLQHLTKPLSYNSCHIRCLQILSFLHKHQIGLTGECGLTSDHLKNALLHRLLVDTPSSWQPKQIGRKLDDVLTFLQQRVKAKVLHHALVGNPLIPRDFGLPKEFREGDRINLFQPLLSNEELCFQTDRHLVEMIKNIPVLIYEYSTKRGK